MKYETESELYQAVIALLSRRDYSAYEIRQKYRDICYPVHLEQVILRCQDAGYQSDQRFAEVFIRSKAAQGFGWMRIRQEMNRKGIDQTLLQAAEEEQAIDWFESAYLLASRKFVGRIEPKDFKSYQKQLRYLVNRGFDFEQARAALERCVDEAE